MSRSRSHGYENSHGCTVASDACYYGHCRHGSACRYDCLCFLVLGGALDRPASLNGNNTMVFFCWCWFVSQAYVRMVECVSMIWVPSPASVRPGSRVPAVRRRSSSVRLSRV